MKKFNIIHYKNYYEIYLNMPRKYFELYDSLAYCQDQSTDMKIKIYSRTKNRIKSNKECNIVSSLQRVKLKHKKYEKI